MWTVSGRAYVTSHQGMMKVKKRRDNRRSAIISLKQFISSYVKKEATSSLYSNTPTFLHHYIMVLEDEEKKQTKHLAKDGKYYDSYEEKRAANIRFNQEHLKAVGLDRQSFSQLKKHKRISRVIKKTQEPDHTMVRRSSSRLRKAPESFQVLDEDVDRVIARNQPRRKKRRTVNTTVSEEERQKLRQAVDWMDELEEYLRTEEQLSQQNLRSVMRQVEKLVSGEGITYSQWDEGVFFAKGSPVKLSDNFDDLYEQAVLFEDEHGRDRGNGRLKKGLNALKCYDGLLTRVFLSFFEQAGCCVTPSRKFKTFSAIDWRKSRDAINSGNLWIGDHR